MERLLSDENLRRGFGEMQALGEKARMFLFAGDRGGVWTYNFTHDQGGVRAAGWTSERADEPGRAAGRDRLATRGHQTLPDRDGAQILPVRLRAKGPGGGHDPVLLARLVLQARPPTQLGRAS